MTIPFSHDWLVTEVHMALIKMAELNIVVHLVTDTILTIMAMSVLVLWCGLLLILLLVALFVLFILLFVILLSMVMILLLVVE